jgi:hypothetical protein
VLRYHHLEHDQALLESTDVLPPPVAADLNGDGRMEVITATHDAKLQVHTCQLPCLVLNNALWYHWAILENVHMPAACSGEDHIVGASCWKIYSARDTLKPLVQVLGPRRPGHAGEGFAKAKLLAEVSLAPYGPNEVLSSHRAVALASGYLDPKRNELVRALRKQVRAVQDVVCKHVTYGSTQQELRVNCLSSVSELAHGCRK